MHRQCQQAQCQRRAHYNHRGIEYPDRCSIHRDSGMVNVTVRVCQDPDCYIEPCFNWEGSLVPIYCAQHKETGMVDVKNRRCDFMKCRKQPSYRWPYDRLDSERYCWDHRKDGMISYRRCYHNRDSNNPNNDFIRVQAPPAKRLCIRSIVSYVNNNINEILAEI